MFFLQRIKLFLKRVFHWKYFILFNQQLLLSFAMEWVEVKEENEEFLLYQRGENIIIKNYVSQNVFIKCDDVVYVTWAMQAYEFNLFKHFMHVVSYICTSESEKYRILHYIFKSKLKRNSEVSIIFLFFVIPIK
jgi:hypothetical protein